VSALASISPLRTLRRGVFGQHFAPVDDRVHVWSEGQHKPPQQSCPALSSRFAIARTLRTTNTKKLGTPTLRPAPLDGPGNIALPVPFTVPLTIALAFPLPVVLTLTLLVVLLELVVVTVTLILLSYPFDTPSGAHAYSVSFSRFTPFAHCSLLAQMLCASGQQNDTLGSKQMVGPHASCGVGQDVGDGVGVGVGEGVKEKAGIDRADEVLGEGEREDSVRDSSAADVQCKREMMARKSLGSVRRCARERLGPLARTR
jgi:hypothetical protein